MKNFIQPGQALTLTAPYAVSSGGGALIGTNIFAVATSDIADAATGEWLTDGVFDLTSLTTDTGSVGTVMYWDDTNKYTTILDTDNTKIGVLTKAKINGDTTARIRLNAWFG